MAIQGIVLLILIILSIQDFCTRQLSIWLLMVLLAVAVLSLIDTKQDAIWSEQTGIRMMELALSLLPGLLFLLISMFNGSIGRGDVWILFSLGLCRGLSVWQDLTCAVFLAAVAALVLMAFKKADRHTALPFVPFLLAGELLGQVAGW